ncbi:MAG: hypothetical protein KDJ65_00525 [Anaerolineae bacterium]|nr:hypothetical protein [Anaerolineae bacterium]
MNTNKNSRKALFAPGQIIYSSACRTAIKESGASGLMLLCRHITGRWGTIDAEQQANNEAAMNGGLEREIVSRHALADGIEIVLITNYPQTPSLRWTEICLPEEVIPESDYRPQNGHLVEDDDVEL